MANVGRGRWAAATVGLLLACGGFIAVPDPAAAQQAPGRLVIIGGGLSRNNEEVYRSILDARQGDGPFCVIPTAGASPETGMAGPVENFDRFAGAGASRGVLVSAQQPETAHDPEVVTQIRGCSGFFFIGGVQSRIIDAFRPNGEATPAYEALVQRWREGAVVSGSSAGAAMMSDPMIAGGTSAGAFARGVRRAGGGGGAGDGDDGAPGGGVSVTPGLGFFPGGLVDQHFLARGRIGRLIVAVLELAEYDLGFGIDENTALVIDGEAAYTVGASGVVIVDGRGARRNGRTADGVRLHLMGVGDRYDLRERRLTLAADKRPLAMNGATADAPDDLFARWSFLHLLHRLGGSAQTELDVPVEGGRVVLRKTADFAARSRDGAGVEDTPAGLSVTGLMVDVRR
jgi:cyanophycinase